MNQTTDYDIIIAGAGMVGATLACALTTTPLRIAVIEARPPALQWPADSIDCRVSAISIASQQILTQLGVWPQLQQYGVSPFRNMVVWDANGSGSIQFDSADIGASCLGHIIENRAIQAALFQQLQRTGTVDILCPQRITALSTAREAITVQLDEQQTLTARLLVGADGGRSTVRQLAGIATRGWPYQQQAIVATVSTEQPHQATAWQRFTDHGPLAFLPLANGQSSIVWSTTPAHAEQLLGEDDATFCTMLGQAFDYRLGRITDSSQRAVFPLHCQHATHYIKPRLALIGDAAHTIHPLAGQGVNLGLLDAAVLADVLLQAGHKEPGSITLLRRYERWRKGDNLLTLATMDGFKRLYGNQTTPLPWLRNTGMTLLNAMPPLKRQLMRQAMGLRGDLPSLAQ